MKIDILMKPWVELKEWKEVFTTSKLKKRLI